MGPKAEVDIPEGREMHCPKAEMGPKARGPKAKLAYPKAERCPKARCARRLEGARRQEGARIARRLECARRLEGARRQEGARIARRQEGARRQKGARRHVLLFTCGCMKWLCRSHNRWQECEMVVQCA